MLFIYAASSTICCCWVVDRFYIVIFRLRSLIPLLSHVTHMTVWLWLYSAFGITTQLIVIFTCQFYYLSVTITYAVSSIIFLVIFIRVLWYLILSFVCVVRSIIRLFYNLHMLSFLSFVCDIYICCPHFITQELRRKPISSVLFPIIYRCDLEIQFHCNGYESKAQSV